VEFTLTGPIIPYVRMTQRSKWVDQRAQDYLANKTELASQFRRQCPETLPEKTPLMVIAIIETPRLHKGDLDNICKAILDAAQGIVFRNDCWIDSISIQRKRAKKYRAQVWIEELKS
jgi:crossover junction endodeoxyribonuclease RusA